MTNVDYIITARHYCARDGVSSVRERILMLRNDQARKKNIAIPIQMDKLSTRPVVARIELGQWIADCDCGGCEFVDPDEPIFFCMSCGNRNDASMLRPVEFPPEDQRLEIEQLILARPVNDLRGLDDLERAHMAKPLIIDENSNFILTRTWDAGEAIEHLKEENQIIDIWLQKITQPDISATDAGEATAPDLDIPQIEAPEDVIPDGGEA